MGQFFKFTFASCLGVFLAFILMGVIGIAVIASATAGADKPASIEPNSVLQLRIIIKE